MPAYRIHVARRVHDRLAVLQLFTMVEWEAKSFCKCIFSYKEQQRSGRL